MNDSFKIKREWQKKIKLFFTSFKQQEREKGFHVVLKIST